MIQTTLMIILMNMHYLGIDLYELQEMDEQSLIEYIADFEEYCYEQ